MSRPPETYLAGPMETFGARIRALRGKKGVPLRKVAAAADMDSTLLSKIELGQRLPTETQTAALARYFRVPSEELQAERIATKFWRDHGGNPAAARAASMIRESRAMYAVDNSVSKPEGKRKRKG